MPQLFPTAYPFVYNGNPANQSAIGSWDLYNIWLKLDTLVNGGILINNQITLLPCSAPKDVAGGAYLQYSVIAGTFAIDTTILQNGYGRISRAIFALDSSAIVIGAPEPITIYFYSTAVNFNDQDAYEFLFANVPGYLGQINLSNEVVTDGDCTVFDSGNIPLDFAATPILYCVVVTNYAIAALPAMPGGAYLQLIVAAN